MYNTSYLLGKLIMEGMVGYGYDIIKHDKLQNVL